MGIDTVRLWLDAPGAAFDTGRLSAVSEHHLSNGQHAIRGGFGPFQVSVSEAGVGLMGSFHKLAQGHNAGHAGRQDVERAIECLSDGLGLAVSEAQVRRLDVAYTLPVRYPPEAYFGCFGTPSRMQPTRRAHSLQFDNKHRALLLYNKVVEMESKGLEFPLPMVGGQSLRLELRYLKRTAHQLKVPELRAGMLHEEGMYCNLVKAWKQKFLTIPSVPTYQLNPEAQLTGWKDVVDFLAAQALAEIGEAGLQDVLQQAQAEGQLSRKNLSDIRRKLRALAQKPGLTEPSTLRAEVDRKVKEAAAFYR